MNMVIVLFLTLNSFADFTYFTSDKSYVSKIYAAKIKVNETIKSQCFNDFFLLKKYRSKIIQTNGKTRQQVLDDIVSYAEELNVNTYFKNNNVIGYRQPPLKDIFINKKFHDKFSPCASASNLAHESTHVMGYVHDFKSTKRRPYSVPYTVSAAFSFCCH